MSDDSQQDRKLDAEQVARRLGISRRSVYRLISAGELQAAPMGPKRGLVVRESEVDKFIQRREAQFCA